MRHQTVVLPYGNTSVTVSIPTANLMGVYSPKEVPPVADIKHELIYALTHPIHSKQFRDLVKDKKEVVIIADDNTRLTPTDILIPIILDECNCVGVPDENITIIIALGTHRYMTNQEIITKFGQEVVDRVVIKNHSYKDPASLTDLGTTEHGGQVLVNSEVVEADFKIGIGSIVPHHIPGFSGGAKIIQPGVSGEVTTAYTHLLSAQAPRSYLGVVENPVRMEMDVIARKVGLHTILNTVLNRHGEVVGVFFGDVTKAFRAGVRKAIEVYSVNIHEEADIVLGSSHPCDIEFWQAHKTLYPLDLAVKTGGIIIVVTPCYEGVSQTHCDILDLTCCSADRIRSMVSAEQFHDEVAAALAIAWAQVKEREQVFIVSDGISPEEGRKLGFEHFSNVQEALDKALLRKGSQAKVAVFTNAPDMLPIIDGRA